MIVKKYKKTSIFSVVLALLGLSLVNSTAALASDSNTSFIEWHSTNLQLLRGHNYKLGSEKRTIATIEHANRWKYGDMFVFLDQTWPDHGNSGYYFEPTVRFSLDKILNQALTEGPVKDILLAAQIEKVKGRSDLNKLFGFAVDFNIPHFAFFKSHLFVRDNPDLDGQTYQITLSWKYLFSHNAYHFVAEGFTDIAGGEGGRESYQLVVPRLLLDVGPFAGIKKGKAWAGIEWQYWHNKFGLSGITESVPQLQLKYVF